MKFYILFTCILLVIISSVNCYLHHNGNKVAPEKKVIQKEAIQQLDTLQRFFKAMLEGYYWNTNQKWEAPLDIITSIQASQDFNIQQITRCLNQGQEFIGNSQQCFQNLLINFTMENAQSMVGFFGFMQKFHQTFGSKNFSKQLKENQDVYYKYHQYFRATTINSEPEKYGRALGEFITKIKL